MKLIFAGTPEFAVRTLDALIGGHHALQLVLTQQDRPSGRGLRVQPSPVKALAQQHGIPVLQPASLKDPDLPEALRRCGAELMIVAAYGLILPQAVLEIPARGAVNIHASVLPRWRGAAPIQRAILAGDRDTGVSIMQMDAGLDTGPVLAAERIPIRDDDTAHTLHDRLATLGARLILKALDGMESGTLVSVPQPAQGMTYAPKVHRTEARIDWGKPAEFISRQIRAFNPVPLAHCRHGEVEFKLWFARAENARGEPGKILEVSRSGILVGCGEGALRITELQRAGGRRMPAAEFVRGARIQPGELFR
ncbi:MAG: methionyl-tRNA formyltransferase [Betaproteobacteria bacterium RIFCSPLOWO2_02_FULL_64_12]|nr:MAG: methionyl-tRNA formyltransferase [Betaproteobacteria bacterium RIFCSPLOWO2_02_FULL_64_12]